jgi:hypothetical protein
MARSNHSPTICQQANRIVSPGYLQCQPGLAREGEEAGGKRPQPLDKARRISAAAQRAHRRSIGRERHRGACTDLGRKVACTSFGPA